MNIPPKTTACRGVRGAVCARENSKAAILEATARLLRLLFEVNGIDPDDLASVIFTATPDLDATSPAGAAEGMGLEEVALLCAQEIAAPTPITRCIRILLHWNSDKGQSEIRHVYLGEAATLRPERAWSEVEDA